MHFIVFEIACMLLKIRNLPKKKYAYTKKYYG